MADSYVIRQGTERNTNPMFMEIMAKDLTELAKYASRCTPGSLGYLEDATVYRLGTQGTWVKVGEDVPSRLNTLTSQLADIEKKTEGLARIVYNEIGGWELVQEIVQLGLGAKTFPVGSQLCTNHTVHGEIIWDVVAHDHHENPDDPDAHTMTLLMHRCIYGRQVDSPELLWCNTTGNALPAGTYSFTLYKGGNEGRTEEDGAYQFTTAQPIPAGGGFRHAKVGAWYANASDYKPENIIGNYVTTYAANGGNAIESNLAVTAGSGGTGLGTASNRPTNIINTVGTFNSVMRNAYGSNNWGESAARQHLNSAAAANAWWQPKSIFDMPPSYANVAGLLNGFDPSFVAALGPVDIITARNTVFEIGGTLGGSYITRDTLFFPSMAELGLGNNNSIAEGAVLAYYLGATQSDRIKYDISTPETTRCWWLRSPNPTNAYGVRSVNSDGALYFNSANGGYGAAPACVIM